MAAKQTGQHHARTTPGPFDPASETLDADYLAFRKTAKKLPERKRRATEAKFQAAFDRRRAEHLRAVNTMFHYWWVCPQKACKRTSSCAGDPMACHERWWPAVPESMKALFRSFILASNAGLSDEDAICHAQAEVAQHAEQIELMEAEQMRLLRAPDEAATQAIQTNAEREERNGPRVRAL